MREKDSWHSVQVGNVAKRVTVGFVGSQSPYFVEEGVPLLRGQNVKPGRLDLSNLKYISIDTHAKWSKSALLEGDVVIVRVGYPGVAAVVPPNMDPLNAASLVIVRPDKAKLDPHFLAYLLNSPWGKAAVASRFVGAAQQVLNTNAVANLEINLPSLQEQQRITGVLRSLDDLIENNCRRIELLEKMAQAIYREWFVHFRYPGHGDDTHVDSSLGPIPEGWKVLPVSDLLVINPRLRLDRTAEYPFITMGDLNEGGMDCFASDRKSGTSGAKFQNGDTLFARITPCLENGKTGLVQCLSGDEIGRGSTEFIVLRGRLVGPAFTYFLARDDQFRRNAIQSMVGASGRQRVRNECFDSYLVATPPAILAQRFEERCEPSLVMTHLLGRLNQILVCVRDFLLPRLVTGKIDVSSFDLGTAVESVA